MPHLVTEVLLLLMLLDFSKRGSTATIGSSSSTVGFDMDADTAPDVAPTVCDNVSTLSYRNGGLDVPPQQICQVWLALLSFSS